MALVAQKLPSMGRKIRRPQHPFQLETRPFQIQPFLIAPVLPGETLKNLLLQARVVSDPIKNKLIGWWQEYYIFYVKHRDLHERDTMVDLMINPDGNLSSLNAAASTPFHHFAGYPNFAALCLRRVVEEYFRNEGEDWDNNAIGGLPVAAINSENAYQSMVAAADMVDNDVALTVGVDDQITASEVETMMNQWQLLRAHNLTEMTYEDYLRQYGVRTNPAENHMPELIRYVRDWTYPSNTVDPTDGSVASAVSWSIAERADKDRFFKEPGWIFGVTVTRPKVYLRTGGSVADLMTTAFSWIPEPWMHDARMSWVPVADNAGPLGNITDAGGLWLDVKDLFMYGDQYINYANTATDGNFVDLPLASLQRRYVDSDDVDALFAAASPANKIRQDGIVSLGIASRITDTSPGPSPAV